MQISDVDLIGSGTARYENNPLGNVSRLDRVGIVVGILEMPKTSSRAAQSERQQLPAKKSRRHRADDV